MKKCTKCNLVKSLSEFNKNKYFKDNHNYTCRDCNKEYRESIEGVLIEMYSCQKKSSKYRGMDMPDYTIEALFDWVVKNGFYALYYRWKRTGCKKKEKPSCDRLDDYKPYTLDNLRLVTWYENKKKADSDRRNGINNKVNKKVEQIKDGVVIAVYHSQRHAGRETDTWSTSISACCRGELKSSNGFEWRYAK